MCRISDETVQQADVKSTFSPGKTDPANQLKLFTTTPDLTFRICSFASTPVFLGLQTNGYRELVDRKKTLVFFYQLLANSKGGVGVEESSSSWMGGFKQKKIK